MTSVDAVIAALEAQGSPIGRVEVRPVTQARSDETAFVLVTPDETVLSEHTDHHNASRELRDRQDEGQSVDLMRREADGTLSTELR